MSEYPGTLPRLFDGPLSIHSGRYYTSRLDEDPSPQYDESDWANVPPESWASCAHGHDWRRTATRIAGVWLTVATCLRCGETDKSQVINAWLPGPNRMEREPDCTVKIAKLAELVLREYGQARLI